VIPKDCKRLAEVDFPIAEVSRHAAREKSIRHGHPSTLHLWWARRPLASSRAMLLALLLPDPCDPLCPAAFRVRARELLSQIRGTIGSSDVDLRQSLLKFIGDFANWDLAANSRYLEVSRGLVKAAYGEEPPLVVDPFAGGGSIPLEALRLGCETFASDMNPVACLILKVLLEDIPRHGRRLAEEMRRAGAGIKLQAENQLADLYPTEPEGAKPIAYLWARTVRCESPNCGAEIPLIRSFWLCKKASRKQALRRRVVRHPGEPPCIEFEIFEPNTEKDVRHGTVTRAKATCLACDTVLSPERVRTQLTAQRGGADVIFDSEGQRIGGARLLAVVTTQSGAAGRHYRLPETQDYAPVSDALQRLNEISSVPSEPIPDTELCRISIPLYGCRNWGDAYTARQKVALAVLADILRRYAMNSDWQLNAGAMSLCLSRMANAHTAFSRWHESRENIEGIFSRQAIGMVWDFCEGNPLSIATGGLTGGIEWVAAVIENFPQSATGHVEQADASDLPLPDESAAVWFTDPPYYDAVPYAHLSDLFYVWLKRSVGDVFPQFFAELLTPKETECVVDRPHSVNPSAKTSEQYESKMASAMLRGRRVTRTDGIGAIVFAHKTTEGWEALLSGILQSGWTVTASWPITTEMSTRNNARDTASLSASVHLVCRPRSDDAKIGDWAEVLRELPRRVGDWMERLQTEGVRGADLVFACIGPALEIFSRYASVETAEGRAVLLSEYLEKVWEVVGHSALEHVLGTAEARARNGAAGALEEDARLTALFLWTIQSTNGELEPSSNDVEEGNAEDEEDDGRSSDARKGLTLVFDVVRRFAQPLGIDLTKWQGRIIDVRKGVVRLLPIAERSKQLFGADGAEAVATRLEQEALHDGNPLQSMLFPEMEVAPRAARQRRGTLTNGQLSDENFATAREATTLDRVHAAMLLQAGGRTNALRTLLKSEQERSPEFLRLANALTALYPKGSEEKRLLDAMLLSVPR
jgi:putative DNA methylase